MDPQTTNSLFIPVLSRFRDIVEMDQIAVLLGVANKWQYKPEFLTQQALNTICTCLRGACFNETSVALDEFGVFTATDKAFSFTPHDKLLFQIKYQDTLSSPSWVSTLSINDRFDRDLLIKILAVELRDMSAEECSTIAVVAFNGIIRAMTWFLVKRKVVQVEGVGRFEVVSEKEVRYDPDPLIGGTIGLKKRCKLEETQPGIEYLGTEPMGSPDADRFSGEDLVDIIKVCGDSGLFTEEEVRAIEAELEKMGK